MDYHQVAMLFDMIVDYFHNKPPPEEHDAQGEWVKVRDGLQGVEHCIRVLTPEEFDDWHRCVDVSIHVEYGRQPVAFCSHEGAWWVIYEDTDESEVIARFERCFEGPPNVNAADQPGGSSNADGFGPELSRFFGIVISLPRDDSPPSHFHAVYGPERAEFTIVSPRLRTGQMSPRALAIVTEWAGLHEKELLEAWEEHVAGREPPKIEPLR